MKVAYYHNQVIIDCGEDWLNNVAQWDADAIFVTHAHPDHAFGLKEGAPCPVYATKESWEIMDDFEIDEKRIIPKRSQIDISKTGEKTISIKAFPVLHSTRAPAVGFRVEAGTASIFYVPDVAWIEDREGAMAGINIYIGDGATIKRSMVRKPGDTIIGHVPIQTQLTWCQKMGVEKAIFTHLGSKIVDGKAEEIHTTLTNLAQERNINNVKIAFDGMEHILR